jgi:hypothetical protein
VEKEKELKIENRKKRQNRKKHAELNFGIVPKYKRESKWKYQPRRWLLLKERANFQVTLEISARRRNAEKEERENWRVKTNPWNEKKTESWKRKVRGKPRERGFRESAAFKQSNESVSFGMNWWERASRQKGKERRKRQSGNFKRVQLSGTDWKHAGKRRCRNIQSESQSESWKTMIVTKTIELNRYMISNENALKEAMREFRETWLNWKEWKKSISWTRGNLKENVRFNEGIWIGKKQYH